MFKDLDVRSNEHSYYPQLYREPKEILKHKNCYYKKEEAFKIRKLFYLVLQICELVFNR
jgi:hypothetical protein